MANNDIIVSEMTPASQINTGDLMIMTQPDAQSETGYSTKSGTVLQVSNKMLKGTTYETDLPSFTNKNVLGGLEELKGDIFNLLPVDEASGSIANFETELAAPLQSVLVNVLATGGNGTPDNPIPVNGYTEANIVNTQNESIVDLFSIDSDFRGTVAFNQLVQNGNFADNSYWGFVNATGSISSGSATFTATATRGYIYNTALTLPNVAGRVVCIWCDIKTSSETTNVRLYSYGGYCSKSCVATTNWQRITKIVKTDVSWGSDLTNGNRFRLEDARTGSWDIIEIKNVVAFDLTAMFGSTIADYIYTLEQNNTGAGVEFFRSIYPDSYYPYDIGTTELVGKETPEATIAFGQTVYGGVLDVTRGKLSVTHANIASYNGESINEPWLSSKDVYTPGGTPTTGAQVVYPLATPFDIDLTPEVISAVVGTNNVFADCGGNTSVKFKDTIQHYIDKKIAQTQALIL